MVPSPSGRVLFSGVLLPIPVAQPCLFPGLRSSFLFLLPFSRKDLFVSRKIFAMKVKCGSTTWNDQEFIVAKRGEVHAFLLCFAYFLVGCTCYPQ